MRMEGGRNDELRITDYGLRVADYCLFFGNEPGDLPGGLRVMVSRRGGGRDCERLRGGRGGGRPWSGSGRGKSGAGDCQGGGLC
jgi:hypothetical protein